MPAGIAVSGLESNGSDTFFCGGGNSGKVKSCPQTRSKLQAKLQTQLRYGFHRGSRRDPGVMRSQAIRIEQICVIRSHRAGDIGVPRRTTLILPDTRFTCGPIIESGPLWRGR